MHIAPDSNLSTPTAGAPSRLSTMSTDEISAWSREALDWCGDYLSDAGLEAFVEARLGGNAHSADA